MDVLLRARLMLLHLVPYLKGSCHRLGTDWGWGHQWHPVHNRDVVGRGLGKVFCHLQCSIMKAGAYWRQLPVLVLAACTKSQVYNTCSSHNKKSMMCRTVRVQNLMVEL